ncbi:hypothetical protein WJX84_008543 [Apatococcus fuscideae]|uniref:Uncharacterized protein n=1 Tax=Apatococcus fuscideae TaxID=2026836 RepID=A0AAW1TDA3_9CHLO
MQHRLPSLSRSLSLPTVPEQQENQPEQVPDVSGSTAHPESPSAEAAPAAAPHTAASPVPEDRAGPLVSSHIRNAQGQELKELISSTGLLLNENPDHGISTPAGMDGIPASGTKQGQDPMVVDESHVQPGMHLSSRQAAATAPQADPQHPTGIEKAQGSPADVAPLSADDAGHHRTTGPAVKQQLRETRPQDGSAPALHVPAETLAGVADDDRSSHPREMAPTSPAEASPQEPATGSWQISSSLSEAMPEGQAMSIALTSPGAAKRIPASPPSPRRSFDRIPSRLGPSGSQRSSDALPTQLDSATSIVPQQPPSLAPIAKMVSVGKNGLLGAVKPLSGLHHKVLTRSTSKEGYEEELAKDESPIPDVAHLGAGDDGATSGPSDQAATREAAKPEPSQQPGLDSAPEGSRGAQPREPLSNPSQMGWSQEAPVPNRPSPADHDIPAGMWGSKYQGETGGFYPRTPKPSMAAAAGSSPGQEASMGFGRLRKYSEQSDEHTPSRSSIDKQMQAAGQASGDSGSQGGPLKRYMSDIGNAGGMADFVSSMREAGGQVAVPASQPHPGSNGAEKQAQQPENAREVHRVTSDIGGGEGPADLAHSLQAAPQAGPSDKAAPSNLSTKHDGPVPRLALEALAVPPSHGPDATHSTESPPTDLLTPEQPTQAQAPSHMPEASHEDTSDAIAEGFGLPSSARDPIRAPSEAPSDAFTDTPRAAAEGETATREMELTAVGRAEGDHEVTTPPQKAAPKYSYLQQIGVIGKGPPPMPSEAAQARQHFRSSPKHPSDTGGGGSVGGWSPRASGGSSSGSTFGVKLRPVSQSPPKGGSARSTRDVQRSISPLAISPRRSQDIIASRPRISTSNASSARSNQDLNSSGPAPFRGRASLSPARGRPTSARPSSAKPSHPHLVPNPPTSGMLARRTRTSNDAPALLDEDIGLKRLPSNPAGFHGEQQPQADQALYGAHMSNAAHPDSTDEVPRTESKQSILKQEDQPAVPMVEARQTILKQELQAELQGALEGKRAPSLPSLDEDNEGSNAVEVSQEEPARPQRVAHDVPALLLRKPPSSKQAGSSSRPATSGSGQVSGTAGQKAGRAPNTSPYRSRTVASRRADDMPLKSFVPRSFEGSGRLGSGGRSVPRPTSAAFGSSAK